MFKELSNLTNMLNVVSDMKVLLYPKLTILKLEDNQQKYFVFRTFFYSICSRKQKKEKELE